MKKYLVVFMVSLAIAVSGITMKASAADDDAKKLNTQRGRTDIHVCS